MIHSMITLQSTKATHRRVTQNISLRPEEQLKARALAEKSYCGNISLLFRYLLDRAWEAEHADDKEEKSA